MALIQTTVFPNEDPNDGNSPHMTEDGSWDWESFTSPGEEERREFFDTIYSLSLRAQRLVQSMLLQPERYMFKGKDRHKRLREEIKVDFVWSDKVVKDIVKEIRSALKENGNGRCR